MTDEKLCVFVLMSVEVASCSKTFNISLFLGIA